MIVVYNKINVNIIKNLNQITLYILPSKLSTYNSGLYTLSTRVE